MEPYLSVVATARNDDHGGNLLRRMQVFVDALIALAARHQVALELVIVEWNPPESRPRLAEALQWPEDFGPSTVRIIEVPAAVHRRYRHAEVLPLYQMIAKNAGIRRARGQFVLATNVDIVFSDELFRFFGEKRLERGKMYRIDRTDVEEGVPADGSVDDVLEYCRTHRIRINAREGSFNLTPEGHRRPVTSTGVVPEKSVFLGPGWFPVDRHGGEEFQWADNDAELILKPPDGVCRSLVLVIEPGPGVGYKPFLLEICRPSGETMGQVRIDGKTAVRLRTSPSAGQAQSFCFRVLGGGLKIPHDPRTMNYRLIQCTWETGSGPASEFVTATPVRGARWSPRKLWLFLTRGFRTLVRLLRAREPVRIGLPVSAQRLQQLHMRMEGGGLSFVIDPVAFRRKLIGWLQFPRRKRAQGGVAGETVGGECAFGGAEHLHTNGCGDFTLLAREHWLDLRGYPEFDLFSMNIDSVFCYAAHHGGAREEILREPLRIYHIEHRRGSGWTPEGQAELFARISANGLSWIDHQQVIEWASQMNRLGVPMIFNRENWGLRDLDLPETIPGRPAAP